MTTVRLEWRQGRRGDETLKPAPLLKCLMAEGRGFVDLKANV